MRRLRLMWNRIPWKRVIEIMTLVVRALELFEKFIQRLG